MAKPKNLKRVAIYARVSTDDKGQDPENQIRLLRKWADDMGYLIVREYVEHESGGKGAEYRKQLRLLFDDARKRQFDLLLFWALDRFSREGLAATVMHLQRLAAAGIAFHSYTEPTLSSEDETVRDITLGVFASLAKRQRQKISENTKAGMARAKAQGKHVGRPQLPEKDRKRIAALWRQKPQQSIYAISQETGIPYMTTWRYVKQLQPTGS
jgi:DNA invertase Pin-like site-specific DNA recombinase